MTDALSAQRAFYASHSALSEPGRFRSEIGSWPQDTAEIIRRVQTLLIYDAVATPFYGVDLSPERQDDISLRVSEDILGAAETYGGAIGAIGATRPPENRVAARCNNFCLLTVAALRAKGIPARARSGFATYFAPERYEDHWVVEVAKPDQNAWRRVDPTLDPIWMKNLRIAFDPLELPEAAFLTVSEVWLACRSGEIDAATVGIHHIGVAGLSIVGASLVRDIAALNKVELLPWDVWGAQPYPGDTLDDEALAFFDQVAVVLRDADKDFDQVRRLYRDDERLRAPDTVFNALRQSTEAIPSAQSRKEVAHVE